MLSVIMLSVLFRPKLLIVINTTTSLYYYSKKTTGLALEFFMIFWCKIGFFKEADTLESSSMLIYSELQMGLYTQWVWLKATLIKW